MNLLFVDLETTNTNPKTGSILQLAAELYVNGKSVMQFNQKIGHDHATIDLGAFKVNRVRIGQLSSLGNPELKVLSDFVDFVLTANSLYKSITIAGWNVSFDVNFLTEALERNNITGLQSVTSYRTLDVASVANFLNEVGIINVDKVNSRSIFEHLALKFNDSDLHDAITDVRLTAETYFKLKKLLNDESTVILTSSSFEDLVNLTRDPLVTNSSENFTSLTKEPVM
jgi:DNA polymerase III epsilon subunit-like protein